MGDELRLNSIALINISWCIPIQWILRRSRRFQWKRWLFKLKYRLTNIKVIFFFQQALNVYLRAHVSRQFGGAWANDQEITPLPTIIPRPKEDQVGTFGLWILSQRIIKNDSAVPIDLPHSQRKEARSSSRFPISPSAHPCCWIGCCH